MADGRALLVLVLVLLSGAFAQDEDAAPATIDCSPEAHRQAQVIACRGEGLEPGALAAVRVASPAATFRGIAEVGQDGRVVVETAVGCDVDGEVVVVVETTDPAGAEVRHTEQVPLAGSCRGVFELRPGQWVRVALAVVATVGIAVAAWWLRRVHVARRRVSGSRAGHRARSRRRGRGRRRRPRRTMRRR